MHTPTSTPRESLYHNYVMYPHYFPKSTDDHDAAVTIVGAGPIGLTCALLLAKLGIKSIVLASELQVSEGSRALVYTKRSMQILKVAGVAERITKKALPWTAGNSFYHGKQVFRMQNPQDAQNDFAPLNNLQQNHLESYLVEAALANPLIELRFGNQLSAFDSKDDGVLLTVDTPQGSYQYQTPWLIAADGGRSMIRSQLGLKLEGSSYEGRFVIVDIKVDLPLPTERLAYFSPPWNIGNTILLHKEPDGIWRFDYQLPKEISNEEALQPENIAKAVNAQLEMMGYGDLPWVLDWSSVYSARALTLLEYVHQRICFVGDAAHLLPIFGVRGANTGFQDAIDLCWKLAAVIEGWGSESLLHTYSFERVAAAREIIDEAGKSTRFMAPPSSGFRLVRDAVLSLSLEHDFVRPLYHWRTSRPHIYHNSPLNASTDQNSSSKGSLIDGSIVPNVMLDTGSLYDLMAYQFSLLYFGNHTPNELHEEVAKLKESGLPISLIRIASDPDADVCINESIIQERYQAQDGMMCLVRPDHHIAGCWKGYHEGCLNDYFSQTYKNQPLYQI